VYGEDLEEIISQLVSEDFLNEERYARSYVRGKFRMNRWGRFKIRMMLKQKQVSEYSIDKGMEEIDEEEYLSTIDDLLIKKLRGATDYPSKQKAKAALVRKGFEPGLVGERLRCLLLE
jgi:regulatory protein